MGKVIVFIMALLLASSLFILICDVFDFVVRWRRMGSKSKAGTDIKGCRSGYRTVKYDDVYRLDYNKYFAYLRQSLNEAYKRGDFDEPPKYNDNEKHNKRLSNFKQ